MDHRMADATEQWLHSLLQSLDACAKQPSPTNSTHEIRLGTGRRVVTLSFTVKNATASVPLPRKEHKEGHEWLMMVVYVLGCIVGLAALIALSMVGMVVVAVAMELYIKQVADATRMVLDWLNVMGG